MSSLIEEITGAIRGRNPLVYLHSAEEDRIIDLLRKSVDDYGGGSWDIHEWTCGDGFRDLEKAGDTADPVQALRLIARSDEESFYVMKDLHAFLDRPEVVRALRDIYYLNKGTTGRMVFILSPDLKIPSELKKEIHLIECSSPDEDELREEFERVRELYTDSDYSDEDRAQIVLALKGLTLGEANHILHRVFTSEAEGTDAVLDQVFAEKKGIVKKSGYLEFAPPRWDISDIGGLDVLKDWLVKRKQTFTQEALDSGVPIPKGLLVMGVSGCGKSLAVKAISGLWNIPMFRLDMNLVFSGLYGSPEAAFHNALDTIESVAPAVLWIDEIENALGIEEEGIQIDSHIFSSFLTWMQEKPPLVFIAATANRIQALPAEIIRKGRFDQVFFVDLPNEKECVEILKINLRKSGVDTEDFDFKMLAIMMKGWNGAEIEQAVVGARTNAFYEDRKLTMDDLAASISKIVPLSETMEQQIKRIRSWAFTRATAASQYGKIRG